MARGACSDTEAAVMEKRTKFLTWKKTGEERNRIAYTLAKKKARNEKKRKEG